MNSDRRIAVLEAEVEALMEWVDELQSGMHINCVYCGHRYGPRDSTPESMADVLKRHVERCPKHPMSMLRRELDVQRSRWVRLRQQVTKRQRSSGIHGDCTQGYDRRQIAYQTVLADMTVLEEATEHATASKQDGNELNMKTENLRRELALQTRLASMACERPCGECAGCLLADAVYTKNTP